MGRRKKPKFDQASVSLDALASTPRAKKKTALEIFVEQDFTRLVAAIEQGHPLGAICELLSRHGISATPKLLRSALYNFATEQGKLSQLPAKLLPDPSVSAPKIEPEIFSLQQALKVIPDQPPVANAGSQKSEADEPAAIPSGWSEPKFNRNRVRPQ